MRLSHAIVGMGVVILTAGGSAWADDVKPFAAAQAQAPWYERFTASVGGDGAGLSAQSNERSLKWAPTARWGVTLNVRDADRRHAEDRDEAAVGAFYHFTPRLRVGGELSVAEEPSAASRPLTPHEDRSAGVKLESAFKF